MTSAEEKQPPPQLFGEKAGVAEFTHGDICRKSRVASIHIHTHLCICHLKWIDACVCASVCVFQVMGGPKED